MITSFTLTISHIYYIVNTPNIHAYTFDKKEDFPALILLSPLVAMGGEVKLDNRVD